MLKARPQAVATTMNILLIWLAFIAFVYIFALFDELYYSHDLTGKFRFVRNELFEET